MLLAACSTTVVNEQSSGCASISGTLTVGPLQPGATSITSFNGDSWTFVIDKGSATVTSAMNEGQAAWGLSGRHCTDAVSSSNGEHCETVTLSCPGDGVADDLSAVVDLMSNTASATITTSDAGAFTYTGNVSR